MIHLSLVKEMTKVCVFSTKYIPTSRSLSRILFSLKKNDGQGLAGENITSHLLQFKDKSPHTFLSSPYRRKPKHLWFLNPSFERGARKNMPNSRLQSVCKTYLSSHLSLIPYFLSNTEPFQTHFTLTDNTHLILHINNPKYSSVLETVTKVYSEVAFVGRTILSVPIESL